MIGFFDTELGRVQISPTIVRRFIMNEVEESKYFRLAGTKPGEIIPRKIAERCIRVAFQEGSVEATLILTVLYGTRIIKEARELQGKIARSLHLGSGLEVRSIAINVENVFEEDLEQLPLLLEQDTVHADAVNQ